MYGELTTKLTTKYTKHTKLEVHLVRPHGQRGDVP
jgi:hypothetical protein